MCSMKISIKTTLTRVEFDAFTAFITFANERCRFTRTTYETVMYVGFFDPIETIIAILLFEKFKSAELLSTQWAF